MGLCTQKSLFLINLLHRFYFYAPLNSSVNHTKI
nr:MAG TPA: hypothetical protein [Bacteriophage sp.]